jgi:hypothetical protein
VGVLLLYAEFLLSCRDELSIVKRAGNACSLVWGSCLDTDMADVVDVWFGLGSYSQGSLMV